MKSKNGYNVLNRILFVLLSIIFISCQSNKVQKAQWDYDCSKSTLQVVSSEKEAIKIAVDYLNSTGQKDSFFEDSVQVFQQSNDFSDYEVRLWKKEKVMPAEILLLINKKNGCVHKVPLK
jgi:hypothetical protein